jgi:hypothetical protein
LIPRRLLDINEFVKAQQHLAEIGHCEVAEIFAALLPPSATIHRHPSFNQVRDPIRLRLNPGFGLLNQLSFFAQFHPNWRSLKQHQVRLQYRFAQRA